MAATIIATYTIPVSVLCIRFFKVKSLYFTRYILPFIYSLRFAFP